MFVKIHFNILTFIIYTQKYNCMKRSEFIFYKQGECIEIPDHEILNQRTVSFSKKLMIAGFSVWDHAKMKKVFPLIKEWKI